MNHKAVIFADIDEQTAELLIALLNEEGYEGFEQEGRQLKAYLPADKYDLSIVEQLAAKHQLNFSIDDIPEENWNASWESSFQPVVIGSFCGIRAAFHPPLQQVKHEIIITPKMSFGTGHHATTSLMIGLTEELDVAHKKILDIGTGTGILAILAEKMGAAEVAAIDNDSWAINNASENIAANNCSLIKLGQQDALDNYQDNYFDIIFANITMDVIFSYLAAMHKKLKSGGSLLISGMLAENEVEILQKFTAAGFVPDRLKEKNGWLAIHFNKN